MMDRPRPRSVLRTRTDSAMAKAKRADTFDDRRLDRERVILDLDRDHVVVAHVEKRVVRQSRRATSDLGRRYRRSAVSFDAVYSARLWCAADLRSILSEQQICYVSQHFAPLPPLFFKPDA